MLIARIKVWCPVGIRTRTHARAQRKADLSFIKQLAFSQYGGDEGIGHSLPFFDLLGGPDDYIFGGKHPTEHAPVPSRTPIPRQVGLFDDQQVQIAVRTSSTLGMGAEQ